MLVLVLLANLGNYYGFLSMSISLLIHLAYTRLHAGILLNHMLVVDGDLLELVNSSAMMSICRSL